MSIESLVRLYSNVYKLGQVFNMDASNLTPSPSEFPAGYKNHQMNNGTFALNLLMSNEQFYHTMLNCEYQMTLSYKA